MNKDMFIDYDAAIKDFLLGVNSWLNARVPRDATDVAQIAETKQMWADVMANPREYVKYEKLYNYVSNHTSGFIVKRGIYNYDNSMFRIVMNVLSEMKDYYEIGGDTQKQKLADAIKEYKLFNSKNVFERMKIQMTNSQNLLRQRQK